MKCDLFIVYFVLYIYSFLQVEGGGCEVEGLSVTVLIVLVVVLCSNMHGLLIRTSHCREVTQYPS